jgi:exosortase A-associated hydrolase 1
MRFDYRGLGDSTGEQRTFEEVDADIKAALTAFGADVPALKQFVLCGLCDGASAACLYAPSDSRVTGLALFNPWVRTEATKARAYLRYYYVQRLFQRAFWNKLSRGMFDFHRALRDIRAFGRSASSDSAIGAGQLPNRLLASLRRRPIPLLLVLSGNDYVAREFEDVALMDASWADALNRAKVVRIPGADHTFSRSDWLDTVARTTAEWLLRDITRTNPVT